MDNNESSFLDKNTIMAIALSILFFIGWQFYVQKTYPQKEKQNPAIAQVENNTVKSEAVIKDNKVIEKNENKPVENVVINQEEKVINVESDNFDLKLSSYGMGFKEITLKSYTDRKESPIVFGAVEKNKYNFATYYNGTPVNFNITQQSENVFVGIANNSDAQIQKSIEIDKEKYNAKVSLKVMWKSAQRGSLETFVGNKAVEVSSSMFTPAYEGTEFFLINDGSEERERVDTKKKMTGTYDKVTLASIGSQYFTLALLDNSNVIPTSAIIFDPTTQKASLKVVHKPIDQNDVFKVDYLAYMGPKKYDILVSIDEKLAQMINYGVFSVLSKPMLSMLKWLHGLFSNWGLAIILLTVFIRILLLPINISSFKSMKKMQKIQPQLKSIKEKYKDDPQRVNQETMALMKKEKANPIGGCLPMLLQLPVFFALYSVLGQSVELYKSPFIFWIQDLSYQDPFYVLPVAVGALYFIQMSLTPQTTMDPTQQKVMKFIPLLFCFFMITVPSGLTLYFFVNTIFGIGQQFILHKDKRKVAA